MILNERMKQRKLELGITYDEIAKRVGVTRLSVQMWMQNKTVPRGDMIPGICKALECTPDYLYGYEGVMYINHAVTEEELKQIADKMKDAPVVLLPSGR